jgi:hypothetical protein
MVALLAGNVDAPNLALQVLRDHTPMTETEQHLRRDRLAATSRMAGMPSRFSVVGISGGHASNSTGIGS